MFSFIIEKIRPNKSCEQESLFDEICIYKNQELEIKNSEVNKINDDINKALLKGCKLIVDRKELDKHCASKIINRNEYNIFSDYNY